MRTFGGMGLAWLVATVVAIAIAVAAIDGVRTEVTGVPTALGIAASEAMETIATGAIWDSSDGWPDTDQSTASRPAPVLDPAPPAAQATETTTTPSALLPGPRMRAIETDGGRFYVYVTGDTVLFATAYATDGWKFNLLSAGPAIVDVRFVNLYNRYPVIRVVVEVIDGTLRIVTSPQ
jgi:hypothetical protein